jgi:hypothetical protein
MNMLDEKEQILRSKFESILELSEDQLKALQCGNMPGFQHALAAKGAVIESMVGALTKPITDPIILAMVTKIQENEQKSESLIRQRLEGTRNELIKHEQTRSATKVYGKVGKKQPDFIPTSDTPVMFDHHR